jgi:hypothetical protein
MHASSFDSRFDAIAEHHNTSNIQPATVGGDGINTETQSQSHGRCDRIGKSVNHLNHVLSISGGESASPARHGACQLPYVFWKSAGSCEEEVWTASHMLDMRQLPEHPAGYIHMHREGCGTLSLHLIIAAGLLRFTLSARNRNLKLKVVFTSRENGRKSQARQRDGALETECTRPSSGCQICFTVKHDIPPFPYSSASEDM